MTETAPNVLTGSEVQQALRITKQTLTKLLRDNAFPNAFRVKRRIRVPRTDLEAFTQARRIGGAK